ncbi:hypothetical protein MNB_SV-8-288 [hydrothermal vent metagenome]|uniref:Uncharacterized protein n=1 Tax=hydrothermal vent metagenome TaxID=652676 RepID=A0A1W1BND7_9ZZZZ
MAVKKTLKFVQNISQSLLKKIGLIRDIQRYKCNKKFQLKRHN